MNRFIDRFNHKQRQWLWFVLLWCGGLATVYIIAGMIRWLLFPAL